jgi:outer membrane receptor protein involved in Fe transport
MPTQTVSHRFLRLAGHVCLLLIVALRPLAAQTVAPAAEAVNPGVNDKDLLVLSRFVVTPEEDDGYRATSTLAGTRLKTNLKDIASSLSVVTEEFLRDTASKNSEDLLLYTLGTEIGGVRGNFGGLGDGQTPSEIGALLRPNTLNRVRGLSAADNTRDFFLTDIPWDAYIVDRVDLQRGPNAILFGLGKPGGIINAATDQAIFKNAYSVQTRAGSFGSYRGSFDINQVLLPKELAIRVEALYDHTKYRQDPAYNRDGRYFGAVKYDPQWLGKRGIKTSLRASYEKGDIDANRPRSLPPGDAITPWFRTGTTTNPSGQTFNNLNQRVYDWRYYSSYFASVPNSGALVATSPNFQPSIGPTPLFGGSYAIFQDPGSGAQFGPLLVPQTLFTEQNGIGPTGIIDGNVRGLFGGGRWGNVASAVQIAQRTGLPFANAYKNTVITDTSIFDFYNKLIDGPNKNENREFDAFNVALSQSFFKDRLGYEMVYDRQHYNDASWSLQFPGSGITGGTINVNMDTLMPDQTPNPDVGRPYLVTRTEFGAYGTATDRESYRLTAFAELRAEDLLKKSWLTRVLGRHVFTGARTDDSYDSESRTGSTFAVNGNAGGLLRNFNLLPERGLQIISYIGPDMRGVSSASGLNLTNLQAVQVPTNAVLRGFDSTWNRSTNPAASNYVNPASPWVNPFNNQTLTQAENPQNYVGWVDRPVEILDSRVGNNRDLLTRVASKSRDKVKSSVFVWQGYLFDGVVIPMFGYRKDESASYNAVAPVIAAGYADRTASSYAFGSTPNNSVSGTSKSYSLVVHTPKYVRKWLPKGINVSLLYNKSSNFEPAAGRVDMLGRSVSPPTGNTKDYGVLITALDERLTLRINKFESTAQNASLPALSNLFLLGFIENRAWVAAKRFQAGLSGDPAYAGAVYNYGQNVNGVFVQTPQDRALQQQHVDFALQNINYEMLTAWGVPASALNDQRWQQNLTELAFAPAGIAATTDTLSKGYEFEMNFRPVKNWDIMVNATKAIAQRTNIAGNFREYVASRNEVWNGLGGELRQTGTNAATAFKFQWNDSFYRNFLLQTLLDGSNAPEVRPWRINVATRYQFTSGKLKGVSVGGAYRWQDQVIIGYKSVTKDIQGTLSETFDVESPYYGPADKAVDLWVAYQRKIDKRINWRIQLNVQNAFSSATLIPINVSPDGSYGAYRIREGMTWQLTNTFSF